MGYRALAYMLILALGLFGATGLGLFGPNGGAGGLTQSVGIAAPLAQDNGEDDNGGEDEEGDNGSDNGTEDNGVEDNGGDNEEIVAESAAPTPTPTPQPQQAAPPPQPAPQPIPIPVGPCEFRLGFKSLRDLIPNIVGNCITSETYNPVNGDSLQITTGGLMAWRKADNWTAFTNGSITWLNGPCGLQSRPNEQKFPWEGQPGAVCIPGDPS